MSCRRISIEKGWVAHLLAAFAILVSVQASAAESELQIEIVYLEQKAEHPPSFSNFERIPRDQGLQGARLAIVDNATTGKFLKHKYILKEHIAAPDEAIMPEAREALAGGSKIAVVNAPADVLLAIADLPEAADDIIFNVGSPAVKLRNDLCRRNVFHTLPSRAMLSDAIMQFFVVRRWTTALLVTGRYPTDKAFGLALHNSAKKFGISLVEKPWLEDSDIRRNAAQEVPLFTQGEDYDVVVVADEEGQFGTFFQYNTSLPRPIAGSAGLVTTGWSHVLEQWGAFQLQTRFHEFASRPMNSIDYAAWLAVRTIGETVTRTKSSEIQTIRAFFTAKDFSLSGYKGSPLSYRSWNNQLRQAIPLMSSDSLVALAPLEGFLHQRNKLDTLGLDAAESTCSMREERQ